MAVAASGFVSKPLGYLRTTLAASSTFQTWTGAADATEALDYIYVVSTPTDDADDEANVPDAPFALVDWGEDFARTAEADGARNHFVLSGSLALLLRGAVDADHDDADAAMTFLNAVGGIMADLEALAGTAGYLDIREMSFIERPARPGTDEAQTHGDFYQVIIRVEFAGI